MAPILALHYYPSPQVLPVPQALQPEALPL
jgi:hypothetical protein